MPIHRPVMLRLLLLVAILALPVSAGAQSYLPKAKAIGGNPGPAYNYVCPNVEAGTALDCFFDAVRHLYTMCRHVKGIEIFEFGYEKSDEGLNGAKTAYCLDKQKQNMMRPFEAALREAKSSRQAAELIKGLHDYWTDALVKLRWTPGETDQDYKSRTTGVYGAFDERIGGIRSALVAASEHASHPVVAVKSAAKRAASAIRTKVKR